MKQILENFRLEGVVTEVQPLGNGLINDTYHVVTESGPSYVLQRINHAIFKDVELLQNNIEAVTSHIRAKLEATGEQDVRRKVLKFIPLKSEDKTWWFDGTSYWRVSNVSNSLESSCSPASAGASCHRNAEDLPYASTASSLRNRPGAYAASPNARHCPPWA